MPRHRRGRSLLLASGLQRSRFYAAHCVPHSLQLSSRLYEGRLISPLVRSLLVNLVEPVRVKVRNCSVQHRLGGGGNAAPFRAAAAGATQDADRKNQKTEFKALFVIHKHFVGKPSSLDLCGSKE